jgi:hypothetical protein
MDMTNARPGAREAPLKDLHPRIDDRRVGSGDMSVTIEEWWCSLDHGVQEALLGLPGAHVPPQYYDAVIRSGHLTGGQWGSGARPWPEAMYAGLQVRELLEAMRPAASRAG